MCSTTARIWGPIPPNRDEYPAGKGDIIEAYENDDNEVDTIVIRSYTYAKIDTGG